MALVFQDIKDQAWLFWVFDGLKLYLSSTSRSAVGALASEPGNVKFLPLGKQVFFTLEQLFDGVFRCIWNPWALEHVCHLKTPLDTYKTSHD